MRQSRRGFVKTAAVAAAATASASSLLAAGGDQASTVPASIKALKPFPGKAVPITDDERRARIEKARRLMVENAISAIVLEPGTSMSYYVDVRWGTSERPFLLVIPAK